MATFRIDDLLDEQTDALNAFLVITYVIDTLSNMVRFVVMKELIFSLCLLLLCHCAFCKKCTPPNSRLPCR